MLFPRLSKSKIFSDVFVKRILFCESNFRDCSRKFATSPHLATFSKEDETEFLNYFPQVVEYLAEGQKLTDMQNMTQRFAACLNETIPTGKKLRGLTTVMSYKYLEQPENITPENIKLANILGWCTELIGGALMMYDDIINNTITRRNNLCWHRKEGSLAVTDALAINTAAYVLLSNYMGSFHAYNQICKFSHKATILTVLGKTMDSKRYHPKEISVEKYKSICKYKTGWYMFYYPVVLGTYLCKANNENMRNELAPTLFDLGELFQIMNDVQDCFAPTTVKENCDSDIEESKCTWLAVRTLEKCSTAQRSFFEEHYGKPGKEATENIRNLYLELNLVSEYLEHKNEFFGSLLEKVGYLKTPNKEFMTVLIQKLQDHVRDSEKNFINPS